MLLIGSKAMNNFWPGYRERAPDVDYICTIEEYEHEVKYFKGYNDLLAAYPISKDSMVIKTKGGQIIEYSIAWPGSSNEDILNYENSNGWALPPTLLMLKLSHKYKKNSPHFLKTMRDIQFLRSKGIRLSEELKTILKKRKKETYNYAHPNLSQSKGMFFREDDKLYVYEHDDIHVAVAVEESPAYTKFSEDGQEVRVSKEKWEGLPLRTKLLAGLEESYVLAIERSLVPHAGVLTPKQAFDKALEKVCTSITSGWFRKFCYDNYDEIQALYEDSFFDKFTQALQEGRIRKFGEVSS